jgi:glutaconyl-CoA/methylmalonyl-CoA decarboxylase subunit delta
MGLFKKHNNKTEEKKVKKSDKPEEPKKDDTGEIAAVIAAAINLYAQEYHDFENMALTIKRIDKNYSPWSSKIYGLRKWPR